MSAKIWGLYKKSGPVATKGRRIFYLTIIISTLRFFARASSLLPSANGFVIPKP
jgi:hypothetical protein